MLSSRFEKVVLEARSDQDLRVLGLNEDRTTQQEHTRKRIRQINAQPYEEFVAHITCMPLEAYHTYPSTLER